MTLSENGRDPSPLRRGAMLVLIAICLPLVLIMAAFAVDVAWMQLTRSQLRTATDAAARAGAKGLSLYQNDQMARRLAKQAAGRNLVAGDPLLLDDKDIEFGSSTRPDDGSRFVFTAGGAQPNAVRVTGRRTQGSATGAVDLLFSGVLGVRQFEPIETAISTQLDRDICLVIDRSGSMMEGIEKGKGSKKSSSCDPPDSASRWFAMAAAVDVFLQELDKTRQEEFVGMASYSSAESACGLKYNTSDINCNLSPDYDLVRGEISRLGRRPLRGRTNISAGLDDGITVLTGKLTRKYAVKTMVLLTDGLQNEGAPAINSARKAAKRDIVIHTITFSDEADQRGMAAVAKATGGQHYHAPTAEELARAFKEIAATLPVLTTD